jgi:molybdenum cofactor cytidylyltransferase
VKRIAALVLAAGRSTRMGAANKLTLPLRGEPLVCHAVDTLYGTSVSEIVVVTGHEAAAVRAALHDRDVSFTHNADYASGMASSIAAGIAVVADADAVLLCLGDMPAVPPIVVEALIAAATTPDTIVLPVHEGRRGHPVLFGSGHFPALRALTGDRGARDVLTAASEDIIEIGCEDPGIHRDIDTAEDLAGASRGEL